MFVFVILFHFSFFFVCLLCIRPCCFSHIRVAVVYMRTRACFATTRKRTSCRVYKKSNNKAQISKKDIKMTVKRRLQVNIKNPLKCHTHVARQGEKSRKRILRILICQRRRGLLSSAAPPISLYFYCAHTHTHSAGERMKRPAAVAVLQVHRFAMSARWGGVLLCCVNCIRAKRCRLAGAAAAHRLPPVIDVLFVDCNNIGCCCCYYYYCNLLLH